MYVHTVHAHIYLQYGDFVVVFFVFLQHKTRGLVSTSKGTQHLSGELQSASDLDFYIDGVNINSLIPDFNKV